MHKRLLAVFLLTFTTFLAFSQEEQYNFSSIDVSNGLSHNQINSILKDDIGFIWFGTMSGLNRYDGYKFKIFKHHSNDTTSISDDYISKIVQGPDNKMWVLTRNGWCIYNPLTEKFNNHPYGYLNSVNIPDDTFSDIVSDKKNNFWFVFPGRGLYMYNPQKKKAISFSASAGSSPLHTNNVSSVAFDSKGDVWIVYSDGMIDKMNGSSFKITKRTNALQKNLKTADFDFKLFIDQQDELWMYGFKSARGAFYYKPSTDAIVSIEKDAKSSLRLNSNLINGVTQDDKGNIWIATDHGGLNLVNKNNSSVRFLLSSEFDNKSLSQNSINCIYKDNSGIIWIGTFKKGISRFHERTLAFPLYVHNGSNKNSLPYADVNAFVEDSAGNIWIGTNGGGLIYFDRKARTFKQYIHNPSDPNSVSNNVIVTLCIDKSGKLWIGSYFGGLDCYDGQKFVHHKHSDTNLSSLADDRVWKIFEDSKQRLWVGTLDQGLDLYDRQQDKFIHFKQNAPNSIHSRYVSSIIEDSHHNIWFATAYGLDMLDARTGMFRYFEHSENDKFSLSQNNLIDLIEDARGLIWVGTRDGLNVYDPVKNQFKVFTTEDGLIDNTIVALQEDNSHHIWVSTPKGVSNIAVSFAPESRQISIKCASFDETDGLQGKEFNEKASLKTREGELVFGGVNGFNVFRPADIHEQQKRAILLATDLKIFNNSVDIGKEYDGKVILPQSISTVKEIDLPYNQNVFTLEFAALNFLNSEKIKYAYRMQGFNNNWLITDGKNNTATFTNLDPGKYTFMLKTANPNDTGVDQLYSLRINILPPWWRTPLAFFVYFLVICVALIAAGNIILKRAKVKFALEQERREAKQLQELNQMKIKFFTNVSHEFRTPLSLILTPAEKLLNQENAGVGEKNQLQLIYRNAKRLLNLVNELLDFKKLEEQELNLNRQRGDIVQFIKSLTNSFSDIAQTRRISLMFHSSQESFYAAFDHDKVERIVFNLLSNAFKFTFEGGSVQVAIDLLLAEDENGGKMLQLKVIDTGIGIDKEKQEKIFERFYQVSTPASMVNQGSGIGLSITKEFVKLQKGSISVESEPGKGTSFVVLLPFTALENPKEIIPEETSNEEIAETDTSPLTLRNAEKSVLIRKTILVVEDSDDFRSYIKDNLRATYNIIEAANGKTGWQKTLAAHPDLVICDISMPEMNGIDLCRKIKADRRTSFIPVVILTALSGEDNQLSGLETGASDFITKPFNFGILQSKIKNLLQQQDSFKKTYQKQVEANPSVVIIESADDKFIQNVLGVIEKNMSNPDFSVEEMSREVFLSRVALYKKLFALTGKTPLEFIRSIRLKRARQLLEKNEFTVAEVAYEVGFNNPKIFSRYFKAEFNVLPSAYYAQKEKGTGITSEEE